MALAAFALFTLMDVAVKRLGADLPAIQVLFLLSLASFLTVTAVAAWRHRGDLARLRTRRLRLHLLRWLLGSTGGLALYWCYPRMPIADAYAIMFTSPLLITALSVPLLRERVDWRRWAAVGAGFVGVLIVLEPGGAGLATGAAFAALAGAVLFALNMLLLRGMGSDEPVELLGLFGNGPTVLAAGALMLLAPLDGLWRSPAPADLLLAGGAGIIAAAGFLLMAGAFRNAPAATIAPFQYSQMVYGLAAGLLLFGDVPRPRMVLGAAIIVASGLYVLHRERQAAAASVGNP